MVRPLEVQRLSALEGYSGKLVDSLSGILFSSACQPYWSPSVYSSTAQGDTGQLKVIQEVITLVVFCGFSVFYLREQLKWNYIVGFLMILGATFFVFREW